MLPCVASDPVKVSVIIPAYNEAKLLPQTLKAVHASAHAFSELGWTSELIVCDNNSSDNTAEIACASGAKVVFEPINQIARARNAGAAAATGDWFIFVDADSQPSPALFATVASEIQDGRCLGGGALVELDEYSLGAWLGNHLWNWISRLTRYAAGSFIFCEAQAFRELGGFSLDLFVAEEIEFSQRLNRLARKRDKSVKIITQHRLATSARKLALYSRWEHLAFLSRAVLSGGAFKKNREQCHIWYDGRR